MAMVNWMQHALYQHSGRSRVKQAGQGAYEMPPALAMPRGHVVPTVLSFQFLPELARMFGVLLLQRFALQWSPAAHSGNAMPAEHLGAQAAQQHHIGRVSSQKALMPTRADSTAPNPIRQLRCAPVTGMYMQRKAPLWHAVQHAAKWAHAARSAERG